MQETDQSLALVDWKTLAAYQPFLEMTEAWYAARCAKQGVAPDLGEARLAKNVVRDWLISEVAEGHAEQLDATDLPFVWLNAHFPVGLDPDRMITALTEWITWIGGCGLFGVEQAERFVHELESTREAFVRWARVDELPSATPEGEHALAAFTWWLRAQKGRAFGAVLAGQATLTAAINLLGDVDGDLRSLDPKAWLERAAYVLLEDTHEASVRDAVHDVIQWYGVTGAFSLKERDRLHRAVDRAHRQLLRDAQRRGWASPLAQAS